MKIVLASRSPRRAELLDKIGIKYDVCPSDFDEDGVSYYSEKAMPIYLAYNKALTVAVSFPKRIVVGVDTIVCKDSIVYGKPSDESEAKMFLRQLSGSFHKVISGVSILCLEYGIECLFAEESIVKFKSLSDDTIDKYIASVNTLDKAGAYAIQEYGDMIIESVQGSINNIIGLPTEKLIKSLDIIKFRLRST